MCEYLQSNFYTSEYPPNVKNIRIILVSNVATTVMLLSQSVPETLHSVLCAPCIFLMSSMACKVFRDLKFRTIEEISALEVASLSHAAPNFARSRVRSPHTQSNVQVDEDARHTPVSPTHREYVSGDLPDQSKDSSVPRLVDTHNRD